MSTETGIDRLRAAEQEAQEIVAKGRERAREVRNEAQARVAEVSAKAGDELAAMRERVQAEAQGALDELIQASKNRVTSVCAEIESKYEACKADAVKHVVEALVTL